MLPLFVIAAAICSNAALAQTPVSPGALPIRPRTPEEALKTFELPPGYRLEAVLTEPEIKEPVMAAFDGNGRMFVAEMRTYMQDVDGTDELTPGSRVSMHVDTNGDGKYDRHTVFVDRLLLPRMMLPLDHGRVIIGETDTNDLYIYSDTDDDGVSDKKELFYEGGKRGGNLEHQPQGLVWSIDNWLYSTYNSHRLRWTPKGALKEPSGNNGGQWGVAQDDYGKLWFMNAGGERGPVSFQVPIAYGSFDVRDQFAKGFSTVWPAVGLADVQGGTSRFRPEDGTLNHFSATCGAEIYRGDRLPAELRGELFFGEPVGRLVRRAKVEVKEGLTYLSNPHQPGEFLRSTDPLFRPLNMNTAPDGTLYIVDMYRGIIQEGNWTNEGSYLRKVILQHGLDKPVGRGRIWRLVHESTQRGPEPKMNSETPAQLVSHLAHPNGWWRDTAQKLLVLKQDQSVMPALTEMAQSHANHLARLHALWTIEGLDGLTPELVRAKFKDEHPQLRAAAIRVSESLLKKELNGALVSEVQALAEDKDPTVALQSVLTARLLNFPGWKASLAALVTASPHRSVKEIGDRILNPPVQQSATVQLTPEEQKMMAAGQEIYNTLCAACHGADGRGMPMAGAAPGAMLAPSLVGSKTVTGPREAALLVLLHGLTGEIDGKRYEGQMVPMGNNDDKWLAAVTSFVRNSFGNRAGFVTADEVTRLRAATKDRTQPWTIGELRAALPKPLPNRSDWKLTASHRPQTVAAAIDGNPASRYDTGADQKPGMWFQIELPQETEICGIQLDTAQSAQDFPRGYKVELSSDGRTWSEPVAAGTGKSAFTDIAFPPARARFVRITQTGSVNGLFWSIHELQLIGANPLMVRK